MRPAADHFSAAAGYGTYRPGYPAALFSWLAEQSPGRTRAWDCGTGTGQAARGLANHFDLVVASDASAAQVRRIESHERIHPVVMRAEEAALPARGIELVTAAQALHWFQRERFYQEVLRVLRPDGVLAAWSYGLPLVSTDVDPLVRHFHGVTVGPWWPPERALVDAGYGDVGLPLPELDVPAFSMAATWTLTQFAGYLSTWSAVLRCRTATGADPLPAFIAALEPAWGIGRVREVTWPLTVRAGRASGAHLAGGL